MESSSPNYQGTEACSAKVQYIVDAQEQPTQRTTLGDARRQAKSWPPYFKLLTMARKSNPNFQKPSIEEKTLTGGHSLGSRKGREPPEHSKGL